MPARDANADRNEQELFALLTELDRLEELLEDMQDLGVENVDDIERRIAELNARVDALSGEQG